MIDDIFVVIFLLSLLILIVGLIRPAFFKLSRKKVSLIFGLLAFVSMIIVGITAPSNPSKSYEPKPLFTEKVQTSQPIQQEKTQPQSSPQVLSPSQSTETIYISKELEFATNRVLRYWKEKEPNTNPNFNEIAEVVKRTAVYRNISYDRAADLIILAFKTGDPDIIEFMR